MTPEQIFSVSAALLAGEPDPDFDQLSAGGHDTRFLVAAEPCEPPPSALEVEGQTVVCGTVTVPENNARDVNAMMLALGYSTYNIYGISYGTRLALEVLRTAPGGVRSVVIDGFAPTTVHLYDDLMGPFADSMDGLDDQCVADEACNAAYPDRRCTINVAT